MTVGFSLLLKKRINTFLFYSAISGNLVASLYREHIAVCHFRLGQKMSHHSGFLLSYLVLYIVYVTFIYLFRCLSYVCLL